MVSCIKNKHAQKREHCPPRRGEELTACQICNVISLGHFFCHESDIRSATRTNIHDFHVTAHMLERTGMLKVANSVSFLFVCMTIAQNAKTRVCLRAEHSTGTECRFEKQMHDKKGKKDMLNGQCTALGGPLGGPHPCLSGH